MTLIIRILERNLRLISLELKPVNRCPKLNSKINKVAKKKIAYEMLRTGLVNKTINTKQKKLPTDRAASSKRCGLRAFTS